MRYYGCLTSSICNLYSSPMQNNSVSILYQDHYLLILNKPAGIVVHPTYKHTEGDTLWDALLADASLRVDDWQPEVLPDEPQWAGAPSDIQQMLRQKRTAQMWKEDGLLPHPCLLHRLDKDTSGVIALARTERSRRFIVKQFRNHTIEKRYIAVVQRGAPEWAIPRTSLYVTRYRADGSVEDIPLPTLDALETSGGDTLEINGPLWRDLDDRRRCIVTQDGQESMTRVRVLAQKDSLILLDVRPLTGRTHQIRAHLAAFGYSIVGDQVYALPAQPETPEAMLHRQFLHAYSLSFRRYPGNTPCTFVAPLADDLVAWMKHYFPTGSGVIDAASTVSTQ
jgi:23S rRNA pseudouridine1911/1915/1917 synthase